MDKRSIQFENIKESLRLNYPSLHVSIVNGLVNVTGKLYLYDSNGKELESFQVKIICDGSYPETMPEVHETGGRIPKIADRHFFPKSTKACLMLEDEKYKYYTRSTSIADFIKTIVEPFFLSQYYFELTGNWLFGERGHGTRGILQFYQEVLGTNDVELVCSFLQCLLNYKANGKGKCFCRSNLNTRDCHFKLVKEYHLKIPKETVKLSLNRIRKYQENERMLLRRAVGIR